MSFKSWFYLSCLVYQGSLNFIIYFYFPILKELIIYVSYCFISINNRFFFFNGRPWQATDVPLPNWLIVPPALDFPTLAARCPRAYRRVPHSSGGSWNLWAGIRTDKFCLDADFHSTSRDLLHAANLATWDPRLYFPSEGRRAEDFSALKNPTASAGFEPHANL
jgi:hypothetical protein